MENEADPTTSSTSSSLIASKLRRLAESNPQKITGPGIQAGHFVPLCQYHNRRVAAQLCERLQEKEISTRTKSSRMFVEISVLFERMSEAQKILADFKESHEDTPPRSFSRDFDLVFLILFATIIAAGCSLAIKSFSWLGPIAILVSGVSLCFVFERLHRRYRYQIGMHVTLKEILGLTIIIAANCAIWRFAF